MIAGIDAAFAADIVWGIVRILFCEMGIIPGLIITFLGLIVMDSDGDF